MTDIDGNEYRDMSYMGIGACILGYADPDVNRAVKEVVNAGSMTTLNCPEEESELAELLCNLHPWADMARFASRWRSYGGCSAYCSCAYQ